MLIKGLAFVLIMILGAAVLLPKPQLIRYQSAGQISEGVYWPGLTSPGRLLDANADFVTIDEGTQNLHVCYRFGQVDNCQQYDIVETFGLIDTISYMLKHRLF